MRLLRVSMVMENNYIKTYDDFLSENICNQLIECVEESNERVEHNRKPNFYQRNIGHDPAYRGLYHNFSELSYKYFSDLKITEDFLPIKYGFEELRIKKYDVGDEFDRHVDVADYSSAKRWLACQVYLNEDFKGGETKFDIHDTIIKPKTGRVLVFPPLWTYPHAGLPVVEGKKYILTTYFHYL